MSKYQYDIISKFDGYLTISIISMDKNMDNAVQLQSGLVAFLQMLLFCRWGFFQIFCESTAWFLHRWNIWVKIDEKFKLLLEILNFPE